MNQPPIGSGRDPYATQPMQMPPPVPPPRGGQPAAAVLHRFGNVPLYVLARFLAFTIDGFAIAFLIAAFAFNAFEPQGVSLLSQRDEGAFGTLVLVAFGSAFLFAFVCEGLFGTTLGKAMFALHVRRVDGHHAGAGRVFLRALLRPIDLLVVGPLLAFATPRHQRLGDFAGGTVVAHSRVGPLLSLVAIAVLGGLAYAQFAFGGGLTSAFGVVSEAAAFGPDYAAKAGAFVGLAIPNTPLKLTPPALLVAPSPAVSPAPLPLGTSVPAATPAAVASPEAPETNASEAPESAASEAPSSAPGDTPLPVSSNGPTGV